MPEIRQNLISRQWVIIAPERAERPEQFSRKESGRSALPAYDPACPFCLGNEAMTPPEIFRLPRSGAERQWQVRVVPNKFPALSSGGELVRTSVGLKRTISGVGVHQVIIESPHHNATLARMSEAELERVIETYLQRYHALRKDSRVAHVTLFKNHGAAAGTSLEHPHSQLIGTPIIPTEIGQRLETAQEFYDDNGRCIFCRTLEEEQGEGARVVEENEHFTAFLPFAALSPFHLWFFPKRHCASFGCLEDGEAAGLARILRRVLRRIHHGLYDPDYNFAIRTAPKDSEQVPYYHWYLTLEARLTKTAGFELGSGMFINVALPEESARFLRSVQID